MTPRASSSAAELEIAIEPRTTVPVVQAAVRRFVRAHGGSPRDEWCVAIAASEAATNIIKFAATGTLALRIRGERPHCCELVAEDDGAGFADPATALRDRISEGVDLAEVEWTVGRRGLGTGLGAIARVMGELHIERSARGGARVVARRVLTKER